MREIKFRAWVYGGYEEDGNTYAKPEMMLNVQHFYDGNYGPYVEGEGLEYDGYGFDSFGDLIAHQTQYQDPKGKFKVIALMQFTGLKDKNGMEIYEGDILSNKRKVIFSCGEFLLGDSSVSLYEDLDMENLEVIGNIYENQELVN